MYTPAQFARENQCLGEDDPEMGSFWILPAIRTITKRRYYTDADLAAALRLERVPSARRTASLLPSIEPGAKTGFRESKKNTRAVLPAAGNQSG